MSDILSCLIVGGLAAEMFIRLPFLARAKALSGTTQHALAVLRSAAISDHWKEKALLAYAGQTAAASIKLSGLLFLVVLVCTIPVVLIDLVAGRNASLFLFSPEGIALTTALSITYGVIRTRLGRRRL